MHVRETRTNKTIDWFTYVGDEGLAISYENKVITWTFRRQTYNSANYDGPESEDWFQLLKRSNPFGRFDVLKYEYIQMFDKILEYPYSMNDLKNRQFLNGPTIINKYIDYDLNRRKKKKAAGCQKMATAFETGSLYQALSKKNSYETEDWCKNYPQNYDNTMHEGRSNKTPHLLPNIARASNDAVRNSKALSFPLDAVYYFCLLNTKDLKSAGEQNVLADFVIMSEQTDQLDLFNYIKSISTNSGNILTIDGYLIGCNREWTLDDLVEMKMHFPHVTTQYHLPYVRFSTRPCIPMKFSMKYNCHFSPAETTHFKIIYPESDILSITAKELNLMALRKTPPAKITVSINNIKGSVAMVTSELHKLLMQNSLGVTCYMDISKDDIDKLIDYAVLSDGHDTSHFEEVRAELFKEFKLDDSLAASKVIETDRLRALKALFSIYNLPELLVQCRRSTNTPFVVEHCPHKNDSLNKYLSIIFNTKFYNTPNIWNLRLRAAFGNPFGGCIEDGVVVDSEVLKHIPPIYYNACITVEFTFKTSKHPKDAKFHAIEELNGSLDNETLIGYLVTPHEAYVKNSKHNNVKTTKLGDHYYYLIHFFPKRSKMYDKIQVRHICNNNSIVVVITGENQARVDVGSKVANAFGQKNIISIATDKLKDTCWGITRDGRKVHAQIVYSDVSLIGRIPSGQLYEMFISNELAIGPNKTFIAPVDLVIHTLHPYTNMKIFDVKVDTLTNINGFDSQNMSNASVYLRREKVDEKVKQVLGMHGYNLEFTNHTHGTPIIQVRKTRPFPTANQIDNDFDSIVVAADAKRQKLN